MRLTSFVTCVLKPLLNIQHKSLHAHSFFFFFCCFLVKNACYHTVILAITRKKKCEKAAKFLLLRHEAGIVDNMDAGSWLLNPDLISHIAHIPPHIHSLSQKSQDKNNNLHRTENF